LTSTIKVDILRFVGLQAGLSINNFSNNSLKESNHILLSQQWT
jgi:hypothetical protein